MKDLKPYIDFLRDNKIPENLALKQLANDTSGLSRDEKNLIYRFCYPRLLGDKELPERVKKYRNANKSSLGYLNPNLGEATLILEAANTPQYSRFIKHLYHAFQDTSKISPVEGIEKTDCPICGKIVLDFQLWNDTMNSTDSSEEYNNKEYLAFTSDKTSIKLCRNCLVQLLYSYDLMKDLDPNFLYSWE